MDSSRPRLPSTSDFQPQSPAAGQSSTARASGAQLGSRRASATYAPTGLVGQAIEPVQTRKDPVDASQTPILRHSGLSVSRMPALNKIPEAVSEPDSPRKRSRESRSSSQNVATMPARATNPTHQRSLSVEEMSRTLPRGFDPSTGRVGDNRQARPSIPFGPSESTSKRSSFPNPHSTGYARDYEMSTSQLQRRESNSTMPSHMRVLAGGQHPADREIPPTPPLGLAPAFGQAAHDQVASGRAGMSYDSRIQALPVNRSSFNQRSVVTASDWSSEDSTPTPTASSIAAAKERNEKLKTELIPITLLHPAQYMAPAPQKAPQPAPVAGPSNSRMVESVQSRPQQVQGQAQVPYQHHRQQQPESSQNVAQAGGSSTDPAVTIKDGRPVPIYRTDFQNLKRISLPKGTPVQAASNSGSRFDAQSPVSRTASGSTLAGSGAANSQKSAVLVPGMAEQQLQQSANVPRTEANRPELGPSSQQVPSAAPSDRPPNVAGHLVSKTQAAIVPRNDGTARPVYSPTPVTLAAARQSDKLGRNLGNLMLPSSSLRQQLDQDAIPSPLPASTSAPTAPALPHQLRFRRSEPNLSTPGDSRPGTGRRTPPGAERNAASDDSRPGRGLDQTVRNDPRRNTFGEIEASMLEEANRKLSLYQKQQIEADLRAYQSSQPSGSRSMLPPPTGPLAASGGLSIQMGINEEARRSQQQPVSSSAREDSDKVKTPSSRRKSGSEQTQRRSSVKSNRSRQNSFGSATTALDSPSQEDLQMGLQRSSSGRKSEKRRSFQLDDRSGMYDGDRDRKPLARGVVAPPSDVPERDEPASGDQSGDSDDTEYEREGEPVRMVINTHDDGSPDMDKSDFRYIPILSTKAAGKARRPQTGNTKVSFLSNHSQERRNHANPTCRQCFRAGFDCAMNLQLGEGTAGRRAFQDFVAAGGLQALSIRDGGRNPDGSIYEGSVTVGDALGRNYVDKLGEVAFGESALSRPVTRGMIDNLLEEKQEQEMRGRFKVDHKPWSADVEEEEDVPEKVSMIRNNTLMTPQNSKDNQNQRLSQMTLQDGAPATILHNIDLDEPVEPNEYQQPDIDPADYDSISGDTASDDVDFLADRWPLWRKLLQLATVGVYVLAMQAFGSGHTEAIPRLIVDFNTSPTLSRFVGLGMLAFNGCQGGGLLIGCMLLSLGRQRCLLISLVFAGGFAVIGGFSRSVWVTLVMQALIGEVSGLVCTLALASIVDMFSTYTSRLAGLIVLLFAVSIGQLCGPWIAKLILTYTRWSWQYWGLLAFAAAMIVVIGIATRETNPVTLFRRHVMIVRRKTGAWTPEPQPLPTMRQCVVVDGGRPFKVLGSSWLLAGLFVPTSMILGVFVFMYAGVVAIFVESHGLSVTQGSLAATVSGVLGVFAALGCIFLIHARNTTDSVHRALHIDEKGYIDTAKAERKVEKTLVGAIVGAGVFGLSLYTLALTAAMGRGAAWLFTAFGVLLNTGGVVLVAVSVAQYTLEAYIPSGRLELRDVMVTDEPSKPHIGVSALAMVAAVVVSVANVLYIASQPAFTKLGVQAYAVIFASLSLLTTGAFVLVYLYGARARQTSVDKLTTVLTPRPRNRHSLLRRLTLRTDGSSMLSAPNHELDFDEVRPLTPVVSRWNVHARRQAHDGMLFPQATR